tara:strand:- start:61 stop:315 length:255 start_codon:yes stop_codon:yes gene_type:complete
MLIKISCNEEYFEQIIKILKLKWKTGAASKAAKATLIDYEYIERECEILRAQNESMSNEIERLRHLLEHVSQREYKFPKYPLRY